MKDIEYISEKVKIIKRKCLDICVNAEMGHVTSAYSCAEIVATLYYGVMEIDVKNPNWASRDRFIMSKNHGSVITYPILADLGFIEEKELMTFMKDGSRLGGHSKLSVPGVDFSGGSLGIGLGVASGMAYGAKLSGEDWLTFALVGDGECNEGSIWESVLFAAHNELNNLIIIIDYNKMYCTDFEKNLIRLDDLCAKFRSFNFEVKEVNGHSVREICEALSDVRDTQRTQPLCIIANTIKGNGIDFMCNNALMHGAAPKGEDIQKAYKELERNM